MPLNPGATFAGFTIVRLLGAGGMGEVYLAKHPRLNRHDALKILPAAFSADGDYRRRFEREADLAASLWHPHIVGIHDRGEFDGQLWLSMDYVDGTDAAALRRNQYPAGMPRSEVLAIITAIASALDFAHGRNLLHRDVKPANILLTRTEAGIRRTLLADFGIARDLNDATRLTSTNMTLGTLSYAAPEQLAGDHLDGRADQYALAGTAWHLLAGAGPFDDPSPAVMIARHLHSPVPPISEPRPDLADLDPVFARALAKDPTQRFATCGDFAAALAAKPAASAGRTTVAAHPPAHPQVHQPVHPPAPSRSGPSPLLITTLVSVAVLVLGGVLIMAIWMAGTAPTAHAPDARISSPQESTSATRTPRSAAPPTSESAPTRTPTMLLPDADEQGFLSSEARCDAGDRAQLVVRTALSRAVVCATPQQRLYYRGARISDGASIELSHVERIAGGFVAINDTDPTRYEISRGGLRITQQGREISYEPAQAAAP